MSTVAEFVSELKRTHTCGALRGGDVGATVVLMGWVDATRDLGQFRFVTLRDRFGPCGGGDLHGETSTLSEAEIDDLVAYMETL